MNLWQLEMQLSTHVVSPTHIAQNSQTETEMKNYHNQLLQKHKVKLLL